MENDDKLKAFFKEHAQPLRREVWFSRRVMNRLPGETRRKIRIIEMTVWFISAIFGLSLCFMFGKSITAISDYKELFSVMNLFWRISLLSYFAYDKQKNAGNLSCVFLFIFLINRIDDIKRDRLLLPVLPIIHCQTDRAFLRVPVR